MKQCTDCFHFQSFRPLTQILAAEFGRPGQAIVSELSRLVQDERQKQDAEAMMQVEFLRSDQIEWPHSPAMTDCCALNAEAAKFLVHDLKNLHSDCKDHKFGEPPGFECATCCYRVAGNGPAEDEARWKELQEQSKIAAALNQSGDPGFTALYGEIDSLMALEAAQAYLRVVGSKTTWGANSLVRTSLSCRQS